MLEDGGYGADGQRVFAGHGHGHFFLIADAKVAAAYGDQRGGRALGGLDDVDVQPLFGKVAVMQGNVQAGVVGVGHVVKDQGNVLRKRKGGQKKERAQQRGKHFFHGVFSFLGSAACGVRMS